MTVTHPSISPANYDNERSNSVVPRDQENNTIALNYKNDLSSKSIDKDIPSQAGDNKQRSTDEESPKNYELCDFEEAITETGYGKYNVLLLLATIPGFIATQNSTVSMSLILPSAECDLDLDDFDKGILNSVTYIGMIVSAFLWGFLSDTLGRKRLLIAAFTADVVLLVAGALAQNFNFLVITKLFSGFIISGPFSIMMAYLSECHSKKYRAVILQLTGIVFGLGNIITPGVAWAIIPKPIRISLWDGMILIQSWRVFYLVTIIPSFLISVLLYFFAESPKFLMSQGKNEEALDIFRMIYSVNTGKPRETFPVKSLQNECDQERNKEKHKVGFLRSGMNQIKPLFQKPYLSNGITILFIQFGTLAGLNTLRLWSPQLFSTMIDAEKNAANDLKPTTICQVLKPEVSFLVNETNVPLVSHCMEHTVEDGVYINSMIIGAANCITHLISGYLVQKLGKKWLMIITYIIAGCCCIGMYWSATSNLMLILTATFITMTSISTTTIISVIVDLYPTTFRTMAVSLAMMAGRCGGMVGNLALPLLMEWNCTVLFFLIAATIFGSGAGTLLLPKTKGAALK